MNSSISTLRSRLVIWPTTQRGSSAACSMPNCGRAAFPLALIGPIMLLSWKGPMLQRDLVIAWAVKQPAMWRCSTSWKA